MTPKQELLAADRRLMSALIRKAVGRCEKCGAQKQYVYRPCQRCVPSL